MCIRDSSEDCLSKFLCWLVSGATNHRELVAAESSQEIAIRDDVSDTARHRLQQLVSNAVTERIVDDLEVIEIEVEQKDRLVSLQVVGRVSRGGGVDWRAR